MISSNSNLIINSDRYSAQVQMAGGVSKYVPLRLNSTDKKWFIDLNELAAAITDKTKILLINTPHNPTGKVFTLEELNFIADLVRRNPNLTVVTDEVVIVNIFIAKS
jgi:aspartate/methionine/tyrosine aminotransferase